MLESVTEPLQRVTVRLFGRGYDDYEPVGTAAMDDEEFGDLPQDNHYGTTQRFYPSKKQQSPTCKIFSITAGLTVVLVTLIAFASRGTGSSETPVQPPADTEDLAMTPTVTLEAESPLIAEETEFGYRRSGH